MRTREISSACDLSEITCFCAINLLPNSPAQAPPSPAASPLKRPPASRPPPATRIISAAWSHTGPARRKGSKSRIRIAASISVTRCERGPPAKGDRLGEREGKVGGGLSRHREARVSAEGARLSRNPAGRQGTWDGRLGPWRLPARFPVPRTGDHGRGCPPEGLPIRLPNADPAPPLPLGEQGRRHQRSNQHFRSPPQSGPGVLAVILRSLTPNRHAAPQARRLTSVRY